MKYPLMFLLSITTLLSIGQNKNNQPNVLGFKKSISKADSIYYSLSGSVFISNGHDEKVKVYFEGYVPVVNWNEIFKTASSNGYVKAELNLFELITKLISVDAKFKLKNKESFVPLPKQFFIWNDESKSFICNYKMMGRNGFGNSIEITAISLFKPSDIYK